MDLQFTDRFEPPGSTAYPAFHCIGVSLYTAPAEFREALSFSQAEIEPALQSARIQGGIERLVIVSTCHRTELYADFSPPRGTVANVLPSLVLRSRLIDWLAFYRGVSRAHLESSCQHFVGTAAVHHLFRLACGLESVIAGEPQIISQVASALSRSVAAHAVSPTLRQVFKSAVRAGEHAQSVAWGGLRRADLGTAAAAAASQFLERSGRSLDDARVAVFGAGETGELALSALAESGTRALAVVNRTPERAGILASRYGASSRSLQDVENVLAETDVAIFALGASKSLVSPAMIQNVMGTRQGRPLALIDVGLPRNVDPGSSPIPGLWHVGIDELGDLVGQLYSARSAVVPRVEEIIAARTSSLLQAPGSSARETLRAQA
jgi:glutamyl-tRNA reductase